MTLFKYILWMSARSWFTVQCVVLGKYWVPILRRFKFEDTVQQFAKVFILHTGLAKAYHRLGQQTCDQHWIFLLKRAGLEAIFI